MRQGQQNRRGRGRNTNHQHNNRRGGQNPLTRSFESTGPDTKIRGTPAHIAEKYMTLARDAHTSGDPVLAENYLQHAEHYNRIIMAYREQMQQSGGEPNGGPQPVIARYRPGPQDPLSGDDEFGDGEGDDMGADGPGQPAVRQNESQPAMGDRDAPRGNNPRSDDRPPRHDNQPYRQQNRDRPDNRNFSGERRDRPDRFERQDRPARGEPEGEGQRRTRPAAAPVHEQPEFLRRPVRRPRRDDAEESPAAAAVPATDEPTRE